MLVVRSLSCFHFIFVFRETFLPFNRKPNLLWGLLKGIELFKKTLHVFWLNCLGHWGLTETSMHYKMRRHGFREDSIWQASRHLPPFAVRASESRVGVLPIGLGFLRQFTHPTIFLKISCDGDYLLPLIVGTFAPFSTFLFFSPSLPALLSSLSADSAVEKLLDVPPLQGPIEVYHPHFLSSF